MDVECGCDLGYVVVSASGVFGVDVVEQGVGCGEDVVGGGVWVVDVEDFGGAELPEFDDSAASGGGWV